MSKMAFKQKQQTQLDMIINGKLVGNSVSSFVFSKKYIHIMAKASIFNILYRRLPLNDKELETRKYEGVQFVGLSKRRKFNDPRLKSFMSWVKGIHDAINKNYLKSMYLFMKTAENEVVETYSLNFKYNTDPNYHNSNKSTPNHVKDATKALLEAIGDLKKISKLNDDTKVEIEFTYTDDTPPEYEPPGFEAAVEGNCLKFSASTTLLASVSTGFHKLTARCSGIQIPVTPSNSFYSGHEISKEIEPNAESQSLIGGASTCKRKFTDDEDEVVNLDSDDATVKTDENQNAKKKFNTSNITVSEMNEASLYSADLELSKKGSVLGGPKGIKCLCSLDFCLDVHLVNCSKCNRQYHGPCYGFMVNNETVNFSCVDCGTNDHLLNTFDADYQILMAKIRLFTYFITQENKIPDELLDILTEEERRFLCKKMKGFKIIRQSDTSEDLRNSKFNHHMIGEMVPHFFHNVDNSQYLTLV